LSLLVIGSAKDIQEGILDQLEVIQAEAIDGLRLDRTISSLASDCNLTILGLLAALALTFNFLLYLISMILLQII